jgi:DNA repair protein RecN (Recombination protein N)
MLERLTVRNLAIVERAELELAPGLNVITGDSGAGKSLLVESVSLLIGERADPARVREGAAAASVEGEFRLGRGAAAQLAPLLEAWGVEFDGDTLIVRREVSAAGRSRAVVNQVALTQGSLKELGERLADLHGQHEHQSLLRAGAGVETLDRIGGLVRECETYAAARAAWREARERLEALELRLSGHAERREALLDAAREIDEVRPQPGEDEELRREASRLAHADRLRSLVAQALERLSEGETPALDGIAAALHALEQAAILDATLEATLPSLEEARIATSEVARALSEYAAGLDADPAALEELEGRRERIARLMRKHRRDVPALLAWREELREELASGEDVAGTLERARAELEPLRAAVARAGRALTTRRRAAAREWGATLTRELRTLGLPHATLEFALEPHEDAESFPAEGLERVSIRFGANPGEPPARLHKTASGGELSRVMLALKSALETQDPVDVRIFDEVDSGIGGLVAQAVGERLRRLSVHGQVVCVSHLPMIAALAHRHFHVAKRVTAGRTHVVVEALDERGRIEELARMLAGDRVTDTTRRQARELLATLEAPTP